MIKKLILVLVVMSCFSCKHEKNGFKGKWVSIQNDEKIIVISTDGDNYTVNINDTVKHPAIENNGILKIIIENDTIHSVIDNDNFLNFENEKFKKINKKYRNPGAGIY